MAGGGAGGTTRAAEEGSGAAAVVRAGTLRVNSLATGSAKRLKAGGAGGGRANNGNGDVDEILLLSSSSNPPPPPKIPERLAALAAAAARGASSRAANQSRAVILALLAERPLNFAALHASVISGLTAQNLTIPPRSAVEDAVKKVAVLRAPGKYFLLDEAKAEAEALLRDAEGSKEFREAATAAAAAAVAAASSGGALGLKVLTPPLQVPATNAHARRAIMKSGLAAEIADGLTDEDRDGGTTPDYSISEEGLVAPAATAVRPRSKPRQPPPTIAGGPAAAAAGRNNTAARYDTTAAMCEEGPVTERVAGDVDDSWMAFSEAAAASGGASDRRGGSSIIVGGGCLERELMCDDDFQRWSDEYNAHYDTYMGMHRALEANALEFRTLVERRDAAAAATGGGEGRGSSGSGAEVAALSRRVAEFRVVRLRRYGAMARVYRCLEGELRAIKQRVDEYASHCR